MENYNKNSLDIKLQVMYIVTIVFSLLFAAYFEFLDSDRIGFLFDEDRTLRTIFETVSILFSLAAVYGALKLFSIPTIAHKIKKEESYYAYAILRWSLLAVSLLLNELTYYFFLSTNVVAFLGICAIALLFVWPTESRRMREMNYEY